MLLPAGERVSVMMTTRMPPFGSRVASYRLSIINDNATMMEDKECGRDGNAQLVARSSMEERVRMVSSTARNIALADDSLAGTEVCGCGGVVLLMRKTVNARHSFANQIHPM